jgi:hypothetical protein
MTKSRMRWAGYVACMGDAYKIFVGKHDGKRPLKSPRYRWRITLRWILR